MSSENLDFQRCFGALTGFQPLGWQLRLHEELARGNVPARLSLPTGLGKTSVIPIWLIALACSAKQGNDTVRLPRRLVYVVNRRTVVDQATDIVAQMRARLLNPQDQRWCQHEQVLRSLVDSLRSLGGQSDSELPLAVSTLRGELADNAEWKTNPARPAIIIGTIDMIGSKLLFSGYGDGRYGRAHHAGLIGQDVLIVHDEAHLTPAFSKLLQAVEEEQKREREHQPCGNEAARPVRVMDLSATIRADAANNTSAPSQIFALQEQDKQEAIVQERLNAQKRLSLLTLNGEDKDALAKAIIQAALEHRDNCCRVLIYVRSPETANRVAETLARELRDKERKRTAVLTGTIRGYERDQLADSDLFKAFKADPGRPAQLKQTLYLVCTSAGEVGVDLDADHLVCDLITLDSMVQRFGRVNRLGVDGHGQSRRATITVIVERADEKDPLRQQLEKTAEVLRQLPQADGTYDASPAALDVLLGTDDAQAAFAPPPQIRPTTGILLDAWSLTSITDEMPGRPPVAEYLHGVAEWEPPETFVAWRTDVRHLAEAEVDTETLTRWCEACPILAHERLRDRTDRMRDALAQLLKKHNSKAGNGRLDFWVVLVSERGRAQLRRLSELAKRPDGPDPLAYATVVLPVEAGGLNEAGMLDPTATEPRDKLDVAEELASTTRAGSRTRRRERWLYVRDAEGERWKHLLTGQESDRPPAELRERGRVTLAEPQEDEEDEGETRELVVFVEPQEIASDSPERATFRETLPSHLERVAAHAEQIGRAVGLPDSVREALVLAARWHDRGKDRPVWQRYARNRDGTQALAKSDRYGHGRELGGYRHEFGSLLEAEADPQIAAHPQRDLILHLIAAHHGWARPHFEPEACDNEGPLDPGTGRRCRPTTRQNEALVIETVQRFGRLQQQFGRWGLAWLESLLRCADAMASSAPASAGVTELSACVAGTDPGVVSTAAGESMS